VDMAVPIHVRRRLHHLAMRGLDEATTFWGPSDNEVLHYVHSAKVGLWELCLTGRDPNFNGEMTVRIMKANIHPALQYHDIMTAFCQGIESWCTLPKQDPYYAIYMILNGSPHDAKVVDFFAEYGDNEKQRRAVNREGVVGYLISP
jgi:hypothetical protein